VGQRRHSRYSAEGTKCPVGNGARPTGGRAAGLTVGLAVGALVAVRWASRRFERITVTGASMEPTLRAGDRLLVRRTGTVRTGDIVAARDPRPPGRTVVKRATSLGMGQVWLLGDNAGHSTDSRHFGPVPLSSVEGKAVYRYAPPARAGRL